MCNLTYFTHFDLVGCCALAIFFGYSDYRCNRFDSQQSKENRSKVVEYPAY